MISLIVPILNIDEETDRYAKEALETIKDTELPFELIIIDDGSTMTNDFMKEQADVFIQHKKNKGYGPSVNDGLGVARGDVLVILSGDIKMPHNWLEPLVKHLEENPSTGAVSPVLSEGNKGIIGCSWAMRRDVFEKIGNFDERFKIGYYEDTDYYWRIKQAGFELRYLEEVAIWHYGGLVQHKIGERKNKEENFARFVEKWGFDPHKEPFT